jgi:hypothetical protein
MLRENALQDVGLASTGDINTLRQRVDEVGLGCPIFPRAARALSIAYDDHDLEILGAMISISRGWRKSGSTRQACDAKDKLLQQSQAISERCIMTSVLLTQDYDVQANDGCLWNGLPRS